MAKTTAKKKAAMIWHIYRFEQRFELPDDIRKSRRTPLCYTKDFVGSGQDNETINYFQQILTLKLKPHSLMLIGAFHELKNIAANRSRSYRGCLYDERFEAASDKKIALWLGLKLTETRNVLKNLEAVGLIEKIPLPKVDTSKDEFSGNGRPPAEDSDDGRKPLRNKGKRKSSSTSRTRKSKKEIKGFETEFEKWKATKEVEISHQAQGQSKAQGKPSPNPKHNPTSSEAPGGRQLYAKVSDVPLETVFKATIDEQAMAFASEVYKLLKMSYSPGTTACRQELFNYYHAWLNAMDANLPEQALTSLWQASMRSASRIGNHRGLKCGYRKPGAGWRSEFNKRLLAAKADTKLSAGSG
ncbi:MAG: hypothetical protein JW947_08355 [Sedimentisphaerales bacterium]|nr:hypothetical protein [Sedimentisphaerales bacterium]